MNQNEMLDVEIAISAPGADAASKDILRVADSAKTLAVSEEMAAQAAEEAAGHLDRYRRRLEGLQAQRERYSRVMESGGKASKAESDALRMIDTQIANLQASMATMSERRQEALAIVNRQTQAAAAESAAVAQAATTTQEAVKANVELGGSVADLVEREQDKARQAAITAGAEVRKADALLKATKMLDSIEAARARNQADLAAARAAEDQNAIDLALQQGKALETAYKFGLQSLLPYERAALRLEEIQRQTVSGAEAEQVRLNGIASAAEQLDRQARVSEANRGRSMSMLIDETQAAIARSARLSVEAIAKLQAASDDAIESIREKTATVKPPVEVVAGWNAVSEAVQGIPGPVGVAARAFTSAKDAQQEAIDAAKAEIKALEALIQKMKEHEGALIAENEATKAEIASFEALTDRTEDQEAVLAALKKQQAGHESQIGAIKKATTDATVAQESATIAAQRGAASVGALVGIYAALFAGLVAVGGALLKAGLDTANLAIETEQAGKRAGVTATEMSRYAVVLRSLSVGGVTVEMQDLAEMMTEVSSKLADAADSASPTARSLKALGLEVVALQGQSPAKVFDSIVEALARIPDPATQTAQAMALLGDDLALKVLPILRQGPGALEAMKKSADDLGLTLSGPTLQASLEYRDAVAALTLIWDGFVRSIGEAVVPLLASLAERLRGAALTVKILYIAMTQGVEAANKYGQAAERLYEQQKKLRTATAATSDEQVKVAQTYTAIANDTEKKAADAAAKDAARQEKAKRDAEQSAEKARQRAKAYDEAQRALTRLMGGESEELRISRAAEDQVRALNGQRKEGLITARQAAAARALIEAKATADIAELRRQAIDAELADRAEAIRQLDALGMSQVQGVEAELAAIDQSEADAAREARAAFSAALVSGADAKGQYEAALTRITEEAESKRAEVRGKAASDAEKALGAIWLAGLPETERALEESSRREAETLKELVAVHARAYASIDATAADSAEQRAALNAEFDRAQTEVVRRGTTERQRIEEQALIGLAETITGYVDSGLESIGKFVQMGLSAAQEGAQKTTDMVVAAQERLSKATTAAEREQTQERLTALRTRQETERRNVKFLWRAQQALQAVQAGMAGALAAIQSLTAPGGAANPLNVAAAVAATIAGASAVGTIVTAQEPKFHRGGAVDMPAARKQLAPDETRATLRRGEGILNPQAMAALGKDNLQRLNSGGTIGADLHAVLQVGPRAAAEIVSYASGRWSSPLRR